MKMSKLLALALAALAPMAYAGDDDVLKIDFLLTTVGASDCVFIRNGKEHTARDAEKHLRMKYRRGRKWVNSVESFVGRIATKSSFSGKPYKIRCGESEAQLTADWLRAKLPEYKASDEKSARRLD